MWLPLLLINNSYPCRYLVLPLLHTAVFTEHCSGTWYCHWKSGCSTSTDLMRVKSGSRRIQRTGLSSMAERSISTWLNNQQPIREAIFTSSLLTRGIFFFLFLLLLLWQVMSCLLCTCSTCKGCLLSALKLDGIVPLVTNPPLPLGKIHPFAIF